MDDDKTEGSYVPALVLGGLATSKQRARNFALYQRLKEGDGTGDHKSSGLAGFVFEVPVISCTVGGNPPHFTFRLDKNSDCFFRLLHVITDHFDTKCDADDEVMRLRAALDYLRRKIDGYDVTFEVAENIATGRSEG